MQQRIDEVLGGHVTTGEVEGLAWAVVHGDDEVGGVAGTARPDSLFRIASMTKPVTAAAAMVLVERCELRLDDPIERWVPELADRRVLVDPTGPLDRTVPAARSITVRDLLTFRLGYGMDFDFSRPQPQLEAFATLGLGAGPPEPARMPAPDEFLRRLSTVPLAHQPGERWLYNTGSDVLGLLLARLVGTSLEDVVRATVLDPLGLDDTRFWVRPEHHHRLGPCRSAGAVWDPADGQWSAPPSIELGGAGLVSTVGDFVRFARMLRAGGTLDGVRVLAPASVAAMTTDHLAGGPGIDPGGGVGWGFGVGVHRRRLDHTVGAGAYGWTGGLGSSWFTDPTADVIGVLLTTDMFSSPALPPVHQDFATTVFASLG